MKKQIALILTIHLISTLLSLALLGFRIFKVEAAYYFFLVWNLFLAWLPFVFAISAVLLRRKPLFAAAFGLLWLLFLPNAPYLVTDLIHLRGAGGVPFWYDLTMLLSFAASGLLLGFTSLNLLQGMVEGRFGRLAGWLFVVASMSLSGYGIYLGRFLRWNSWDVLTNPRSLAGDMLTMLRHPITHIESYVITAVFAFLFLVAYVTVTAIGSIQKAAVTK